MPTPTPTPTPGTLNTIVLATANPHKVEELQAIFAGSGLSIRLLTLKDVPTTTEPHEHGGTFEENATIKALSYAEQTGLPCLADDSGLEVDILGGKPGVISSHYCTDGQETGMSRAARDAANNKKLLMQLEEVPADRRTARFVCVMALAAPDPKPHPHAPHLLTTTRGTFEGRIGIPPRVPGGTDGFGYDPLFLVAPDFTRTSAELSPEQKNKLSHRGHAARRMAAWLKNLV